MPTLRSMVLVGTYAPHGEGIHRFEFDASTGALMPAGLAASLRNASRMVLDPARRHLYAVSEVADFDGQATGSVSAFATDGSRGELRWINTVSSGGAEPAHLSVHPAGRHVFVANYRNGRVAVMPLREDGGLAPACDMRLGVDACPGHVPPGRTGAERAPPGSFARSDHDASHAHMAASDPGGRFVVVNDLGLDRTIVWRFDPVSGRLSDPRCVPASSGAAPRHFVFHPNGRWFYSINEESSTLVFMRFDPDHGALDPVGELSTLPPGFVGTSYASDLVLSPEATTLYALNRLHDSIAIFALDAQGRPRWTGEEWTRGSFPRSLAIEPGGRYAYVCNQRSDHIAIFRVEAQGLRFTGRYVAVGSPAMAIFLQG